MQQAIGTPEIIILALLFIFGLWWFLSFIPGKAFIAASTLLVSFSIGPVHHPAPEAKPQEARMESPLV